MFDMILC